jgi:hypothetical protein
LLALTRSLFRGAGTQFTVRMSSESGKSDVLRWSNASGPSLEGGTKEKAGRFRTEELGSSGLSGIGSGVGVGVELRVCLTWFPKVAVDVQLVVEVLFWYLFVMVSTLF